MSASSPTGDLRDLSREDSEELRAFLEKGRWFESKLKVLEELPAIYPFLHPRLLHTAGDLQREGEAQSQWKLPSIKEVQQWQQERDTLEEDVLAFDGGDLGRMKEKTRAVTSVPLTPPSTHLVEITLALIVVVDRLLGLLRHRSDLLELTSLRLQWDVTRWRNMKDIRSLRAEIKDLASDGSRWSSGASRDSIESNMPPSSTPVVGAHTTPRALSSAFASPSLAQSPPIPNGGDTPTVHTRILNLQTRAKTLLATSVTRSGALLDQMIDLAGPLKGLGDTRGPSDKEGKKGAVPDELLDVQDELEGEVGKAKSEVAWCKQLGKQWDAAESFHAACKDAPTTADRLLDAISSSLDRPASSEQHQALQLLFQDVAEAMPKALNNTFPRPWHEAYLGSDAPNERIIRDLTKTRKEAASAEKESSDAMKWYEKLLSATQAVQASQAELEDLLPRVSIDLCLIEHGNATAPIPTMDPPFEPVAISNWLRVAPQWISNLDASHNALHEATIRASAALRIYSRTIRVAPRWLRDRYPDGKLPDELGSSLSGEIQEMQNALQEAVPRLRMAEGDVEILEPFVLALRTYPGVVDRSQQAQIEMKASIRATAWSQENREPLTRLGIAETTASEVLRALRDVLEAVERAQDVLSNSGRDRLEMRQLQEEMRVGSAHHIQLLEELISLDDSIRTQSRVMVEIQSEATSMGNDISALRQRLKNAEIGSSTLQVDPAILAQIIELGQRKDAWSENLASRVIFIPTTSLDFCRDDPLPPQSLAGGSQQSGTPRDPQMSASAPPLTPPATPPLPPPSPALQPSAASITTQSALEEVNARVRQEINEQSARVAGDFAALQQATARIPFDRWIAKLEGLLADLERCMTDIGDTTTSMTRHRDFLLGRHSIQAAELETLKNEALIHYGRLQSILKEALGALEDWTSDAVISQLGAVDEVEESRQMVEKIADTARTLLAGVESCVVGIESMAIPVSTSVSSKDAEQPREDVFGSRIPRLASSSSMKSGRKAKTSSTPSVASLPEPASAPAVDAFNEACEVFDRHLSALFDAVDNGADSLALSKHVEKVSDALSQAEAVSVPIEDDQRVRVELQRLRATLADTQAMFSSPSGPVADVETTSVSSVSTKRSTSQPLRAAASNRSLRPAHTPSRPSSSRSTSNPTPGGYLFPAESSRHRAVSDNTRKRIDSLRADGLPRTRQSSTAVPPSRIPRASKASWTPDIQRQFGTAIPTTPRIRKESTATVTPARAARPRKSYVANPKNKLDMAVGQVINKMKVNVPIVPIGLERNEASQTGRYWIGAEGRAKLCFCRILRSKMVMVRVGGGWVELSRFLMDHFVDAFWAKPFEDAPPLPATTPLGIGSAVPVTITSASLAATSATADHRVPPPGIAASPAFKALGPSTPVRKVSTSSPLTPSMSPASGSPLLPVHFMRKASESPPVREREKAQLSVGRRSILGREVGSTGSPRSQSP